MLDDGFDVNVLDNFSNSRREDCPARAKLFVGDVTNPEDVKQASKDCELIFHLAAKISVPDSIQNPEPTMRTNAGGTRTVLENSPDAEAFVLASSAAVYGDATKLPVGEGTPLAPLSPYGQSKIDAERACERFSLEAGMRTSALRMFNVYGRGQSKEYAGVITIFINNARNGTPLRIFGDGSQTRDFVYVKDVVRAYPLAAKRAGTYNIGSGMEITIEELAGTILRLTGSDSQVVHEPAREGDILRSVASITLAEKKLGWHPTTNLAEGLRELL